VAALLLRWLPSFLVPAAGALPTGVPDWLEPLLACIEQRLAGGLEPAALPRLAGVGAAHLARSFRRHLGLTPTAYLNRQRLRRAALELARGERPVLAIALDLGFASPSHFSRSFAQAFGQPPTVYRRAHRMG